MGILVVIVAITREGEPDHPMAKKATEQKKKTAKKPVEVAKVLSSEVAYQGPLFRVTRDRIVEPEGSESTREVVRHNGSVVILAIDSSRSKKDPWVVIERQYRHAAGQYLWELPAGKLDPGEEPLTGAQRELEEETGYRAKKWKLLIEYWASPGFLGESMKLYLAEGLIAGEAHPEEDEKIDFRLVKLSELLKKIAKGEIKDGKTLVGTLLYARKLKKK
jgi:ADP-ribose pyrophosphatase